MASEDSLRAAIKDLTKLGVSQKILAAEIGVSETWLSRWLRNQGGVRGMTLSSLDAFARYVNKLRKGVEAAARISIAEVNQEAACWTIGTTVLQGQKRTLELVRPTVPLKVERPVEESTGAHRDEAPLFCTDG